MGKQTVEALIQGGKATAAPPLGPALGPLGVNIGLVVAEINKKTKDFNGMQVPVKVTVDDEDKTFTISVGTPPVSALIKKEANVQKGSGVPNSDKVADLRIEQIIKIAKMKEDALLGSNMKAKVREVVGSCNSMGVLVEGKEPRQMLKDIADGVYDAQIKSEKTELSSDELKALEEERKKLQADLEKKRKEFETLAKSIAEQMEGKTRSAIKQKMQDARIPAAIMDQFLPASDKAGKGAAPAKGGKK